MTAEADPFELARQHLAETGRGLARRRGGENPALWQLAFRPFFLLSGIFGFASIAYWGLVLDGSVPFAASRGFDPISWHSHEMLFGFAPAVIAGFLLTAIRNWTGMPPVTGLKLQVLASAWVLGRLAMTGILGQPIVAAVLDLLFFPLLCWLILPYYKDPELTTERVFFVFFALYFVANAATHLAAMGAVEPHWSRRGAALALGIVVQTILFIGGRVIPFFTESTLARRQPRSFKGLDFASHAAAAVFFAYTVAVLPEETGDGAGVMGILGAVLAYLAAAAHAAKLWYWQVPRVRRVPLIWVLHLSYLWIVAGFALAGFVRLGAVSPPSIATHAFTVGGIGIVIYGMMTRVSLGHTGRRLHPSRWTVVGYFLLAAAALIRVVGAAFLGEGTGYVWVMRCASLAWVAAFGIFVAVYAPILARPRVDGRPG